MKNTCFISGRRVLLAGALGLVLMAQPLWPANAGRGAAPINRGAVGAVGRNGTSIIGLGSANYGNGAYFGGGGYGYNPVVYGYSSNFGRGGYSFSNPGVYGGGRFNESSATAAASRVYNTPLYYALLRRSAAMRFAPGATPYGADFNASLFNSYWPVGPFRNFFWNESAIAESFANLNYFRGGVNNFLTSVPLRPYYISPDYFNLHPLVYFTNPGRFNLGELQVRALREQLRNGGILLFDDHWGNRDRERYLAEARRIFANYSLVELPVDRAFNPYFYALLVKPLPLYFGGVRQSAFTFVIDTPAQQRVTTEVGTYSGYFGADGQVIILAN